MEMKEKIVRQETALVFDHFGSKEAKLLGDKIASKMEERGDHALFFIRLNSGLTLYQYAAEGAVMLNQVWAEKKFHTARIMGKSSMLALLEAKEIGQTMADHGLQDTCAYAPGAFPIYVKGSGMIGAVSVSGIMDLTEHDLVPMCMAEMLDVTIPYITGESC